MVEGFGREREKEWKFIETEKGYTVTGQPFLAVLHKNLTLPPL
jgi:hypothetical protein